MNAQEGQSIRTSERKREYQYNSTNNLVAQTVENGATASCQDSEKSSAKQRR